MKNQRVGVGVRVRVKENSHKFEKPNTMRTRGKCSIPVTNPNPTAGGDSNVSIYEKCRQERIKENLQRMQSLGILDLSLKLKSETRPVKRQYRKANSDPDPDRDSTPPLQLSVSTRRSSRLI